MSNSRTDNETWSKKLVKYMSAYTEQSRIVRTGDPSAPAMLIELEGILEDYSDPFICSLHTKSLDESFRSKLEALKQHISSLECSSQKPMLPSAPVTQDARMRTIRALNNMLCNKIMDSLQCFGVPILIIEFEGDAFVRQAMQRGLSNGGEGQ